jgi:hypothetical protein
MKAKDVLRAVCCTYDGRFNPLRNICVPNSTNVSRWESDLLVIRPTGWVDEVEIKVTVSDFRAELRNKWEKHLSLRQGKVCTHLDGRERNRFSYWRKPGDETVEIDGKQIWVRGNSPTIIRRFWFAMPADVFAKVEAEVPAWAGILTVGESEVGWKIRDGVLDWKEVRAAKQLPSRRATDADRVKALTSIHHRAWSRSSSTFEIMDLVDSEVAA